MPCTFFFDKFDLHFLDVSLVIRLPTCASKESHMQVTMLTEGWFSRSLISEGVRVIDSAVPRICNKFKEDGPINGLSRSRRIRKTLQCKDSALQ